MVDSSNFLEDALTNLGLNSGDSVLVHSDSSLAMAMSGAEWWDEAFDYQANALRAALGPNGTVLVPTFNYDFCEGKPYDHDSSPSQVGMFTNYVRELPESSRSFHPIFSFAGFGPAAKQLLTTRSNSSFGRGSVFENLYDSDSKLLFVNVSFEFCTFVHFVEQRIGIDYRYPKEFRGTVTRENQSSEDSFDFYVRYLDRTVDTFFGRLEQRLIDSGEMRSTELGDGRLTLTSSRAVFDAASALISEDPYSLLKSLPVMLDQPAD
jgi:aminoglycoside 3-N-acetyltransferase